MLWRSNSIFNLLWTTSYSTFFLSRKAAFSIYSLTQSGNIQYCTLVERLIMRRAYVIYRRVKYRYEYINMAISAVPFILGSARS
jgi:hypothetical protein